MKRLLVAIALTTSVAAIAQTQPEVAPTPAPETETTAPDPAMTTTTPAPDASLAPAPAPAPMATPSTGSVQAPGNTNPERDARGIAVISDAAIVPAGYNGTPATGVGGPVTDPATGEALNSTDSAHPPCTREVTDNCVQTYERGRSPQ